MPNPELRQMLAKGEVFFAPTVWNPPTARLAHHFGFKALYIPGKGTGIMLGQDEAMTNLTQTVTVADRVLESIRYEAPVIVDALSGFGNSDHVQLTVRQLEGAGVSAIHLGDTDQPARAATQRKAVSIDQFKQRIGQAVKARMNKDFLIIARLDASSANDPAASRVETVKRANAVRAAGADALFLSNMSPQADDLQFYRAQIKDIPLATTTNSGAQWFVDQKGQPLSLDDYKGLGYQLIFYEDVIQPSLLAVHDVYRKVKDTGYLPDVPEGEDEKAHSIMWRVVGMEEKWAVEAVTTEIGNKPIAEH